MDKSELNGANRQQTPYTITLPTGTVFIKDMSDAQIQDTMNQASQQQNQIQQQILQMLNNQMALVSTVAILGYEQDRRRRSIVIAPAFRGN